MTTINTFKHATDVRTFLAGEQICVEGEYGDEMYVVQSGTVQVLMSGKQMETVGEGGIVGEMGLISDQPRSATVIADTDCTLVPIDTKRFTFLVQQTPHFALQVMQIMADRLRLMNEAYSV
jgi:CRP-like cAMP-binding protein